MRKLIFALLLTSSLFAQKLNSFFPYFEKNGIDLTFAYTGELFSNFSGGEKQKNVYLDNFDFIVLADLEKILGLKNSKLKFYMLGNNGSIPSEYTATAQGTSNIAAYSTFKIYEFWIEKKVAGNLSILAGLFDLNSEFDTRESSSIFINPSHGIGPDFSMTGENGPSIFPNAALAFRIKYNPTENFYINSAVFEGTPDDPTNPTGTKIEITKDEGVLLVTEMGITNENKKFGKNNFTVSLGAWLYTREFKTLALVPQNKKGNYGIYLSSEKTFIDSEKSELAVFFRYGFADSRINTFDNYLGAGFTLKGILTDNKSDALGVALGIVHLNGKTYSTHSTKHEAILEITYVLNVNDFISLQPDLQIAINPANTINHKHSSAAGLRLALEL